MGIDGKEKKEDRGEIIKLICFKLAGEEYALNVMDIQEVIRPQEITVIPQMPEHVLGVINLRGIILPQFDLRKKLQLSCREFDDNTKNVVVKIGNKCFSIIVDEIVDNISMDQSEIDPAPDVKMKISRECIKGLGKLEGRLVTILNLGNIFEEIE